MAGVCARAADAKNSVVNVAKIFLISSPLVADRHRSVNNIHVNYRHGNSTLTELDLRNRHVVSYIVHLLQPYHRNLGKRIVKTPKLYFCDTGLASSLLSVQGSQHAAIHPRRPALFETLVVVELLKQRLNAGLRPNLYFWRDNVGRDVDVVIEEGNDLVPIEIKSGLTVNTDLLTPMTRWIKYAGTAAKNPTVVYGGGEAFTRSGARFVPWDNL